MPGILADLLAAPVPAPDERTACATFVHRRATGKRLRQRAFSPSGRSDRRFGPKPCRIAVVSASFWAKTATQECARWRIHHRSRQTLALTIAVQVRAADSPGDTPDRRRGLVAPGRHERLLKPVEGLEPGLDVDLDRLEQHAQAKPPDPLALRPTPVLAPATVDGAPNSGPVARRGARGPERRQPAEAALYPGGRRLGSSIATAAAIMSARMRRLRWFICSLRG